MAPKKAASKATTSLDDAAKADLLAEKKGKAGLVGDVPHEALEDGAVNNKRHRQENPPTPEGTIRTCSSEGLSRDPPPGFTPPEADNIIEDGEVLGISAEDQLKLHALRIKNNHLQKQKEILAAKRQRITMQVKVSQMILDEEQKAKELEQQIAEMQGEDPIHQRQDPGHRFRMPVRAPATFHGLNYLDERSPLAPQFQASSWPQN
jgi:hypothetical protein